MARNGVGQDDESGLEELGVEFEISKERVRQIEMRAREKLRKCEYADLLRDFVE